MDRFESAKKAGMIGVLGNVFLLCIKAIIGVITGSQAMIADAANSAGDIFASFMTFVGNKIASEPSDENHTFGHGKAEYLFSFLISISMMIVAVKLLFDSITSLIQGNELVFSYFLVLVCIITILVKLCLYGYTKMLYQKHKNILIEANMKDHRNDCVVTSFTLISILFSLLGIYWLDGVVGIGISLWICFTGIKIFIESYNVLMDISLNNDTKDIILDLVHTHKEIKKIDTIYSTPVGYQYLVTFTIYVDGNMSTFESHEVADELEKEIKQLDNVYDSIIHVNPI